MEKIVVFGTGSFARKLLSIIDLAKVEIIGFVDNDLNKIKTTFFNRHVFAPSELKKIEYDYIVIASSFYQEIKEQLQSYLIEENKIINLEFLDHYIREIDLINKFAALKSKSNMVEVICTGLSYIRDGINEQDFNKRLVLNFGYSSQDLCCDYHILNHILNTNYFSSLRTIVLGLSYYSFNYSLSKTKNAETILPRYFSMLGLLPNFSRKSIESYIKNREKIFKWCRDDIEIKDFSEKYLDSVGLDIEAKQNGKKVAIKHITKYYPKTVIENKNYFRKICELGKYYNLDIRIIIFPVSKYYSKFIKEEYVKNFYEIINDTSVALNNLMHYYNQNFP